MIYLVVMTKNVILQLSRDHPDDIISITDDQGRTQQRKGLVKQLPETYLQKPLSEAVSYMTDPSGDEHNPAMTDAEKELATKYEIILEEPQYVLFHPRIANEYNTNITLFMDDMLSDKLEQIVQSKELIVDGERQNYKSIDLLLKYEPGGGYE